MTQIVGSVVYHLMGVVPTVVFLEMIVLWVRMCVCVLLAFSQEMNM